MKQIKRTKDPRTDKWPHYYNGENGRGYAYATLVNSDFSALEDAETLISADTYGNAEIHVAIELETEDMKVGLGADLTPEDARRLADSLQILADRASEE